ncbi:MAG: hypothetical protein AB7P76_00300 [Candidatus Melainabacteria bacterium]
MFVQPVTSSYPLGVARQTPPGDVQFGMAVGYDAEDLPPEEGPAVPVWIDSARAQTQGHLPVSGGYIYANGEDARKILNIRQLRAQLRGSLVQAETPVGIRKQPLKAEDDLAWLHRLAQAPVLVPRTLTPREADVVREVKHQLDVLERRAVDRAVAMLPAERPDKNARRRARRARRKVGTQSR